MDIQNAISSLHPDAVWWMDGDSYEDLNWSESNAVPKPTKQELKKEITRLKKIQSQNQYVEHRVLAYPSVEEQLDMLWHAMDADEIPGKDSEWYNQILIVKQKYPKQK